MAIHDILVQYRIGTRTRRWITIPFGTPPELSTNTVELNNFGSRWGSTQILRMGGHYDLYRWYNPTTAPNTPPWRMPPRFRRRPGLTLAQNKIPAPSVSGNFGEVLPILVLERMKGRRLIVGHLKAARGQSAPDLLVESAPLNAVIGMPPLPRLIPMECKTSSVSDALIQLARYWFRLGMQDRAFGFGVISNMEYQPRRHVRFTIIVPIPAQMPLFAARVQQRTLTAQAQQQQAQPRLTRRRLQPQPQPLDLVIDPADFEGCFNGI